MHPSLFKAVLLLSVCSFFFELSKATSVSFQAPFYTSGIPGWDFGGSAVLERDHIRLTPANENRRGWLFAEEQVPVQDWQVDFQFFVRSAKSPGADGFAFWVIRDPPKHGSEGGLAFGLPEKWVGLGIFFDTFDNDGQHDNPSIYAIVNNGSLTYDQTFDGLHQSVGRCTADYRNLNVPAAARIVHQKNTLTLWTDLNSSGKYDICFTALDVPLPHNLHFGFSAATGYYSDNHDILSFHTSYDLGNDQAAQPPSDEGSNIPIESAPEIPAPSIPSAPVSENPVKHELNEWLKSSGDPAPDAAKPAAPEPVQNPEAAAPVPPQAAVAAKHPVSAEDRPSGRTAELAQNVLQQLAKLEGQHDVRTKALEAQSKELAEVLKSLRKHSDEQYKHIVEGISLVHKQLESVRDVMGSLKASDGLKKTVEELQQLGQSTTEAVKAARDATTKEVAALKGEMDHIKSSVKTSVKEEIDTLTNQIKDISVAIGRLKGHMEGTSSKTGEVLRGLQENIKSSVQRSYLFYFLFFQFLAIAFFVYWKRVSDYEKKLL